MFSNCSCCCEKIRFLGRWIACIVGRGIFVTDDSSRLNFWSIQMAPERFRALILGAVVFVGCSSGASVRAQDGKRLEPYPHGLEIAFEWRYSCPNGKGCSFTCPRSG